MSTDDEQHSDGEEIARRPISTRNTKWAERIAARLTKMGIKPNVISVCSSFSALVAGASFFLLPLTPTNYCKYGLFVVAIIFIQGRLLCNLFDGMVAVEGGFKTASGEIFNDFPDRISDALIFIGAGYAVIWVPWGVPLGWSAAILAIMTAYTRVLGVSTGTKQHFLGPMAKQHRMAVMTAAALVSLGEVHYGYQGKVLVCALGVVVVGSLITVVRRLRVVVRELEHAE